MTGRETRARRRDRKGIESMATSLTEYRRAAALAVLLGAGAGHAVPLDLPVCDRPPLLDGRLDDPAWRQAVEVPHLYGMNSDQPAPETSLRLMRDGAWFYLGATCRNPRMEHVSQRAFEAGGPVNDDDSLETFIRPSAGDGEPYYHVLLNFAGVLKTQRCTESGERNLGWTPPCRAATRREADGWTAELAIPWFCLAARDLSGLRLNIGRNLMAVDLDAYGAKQGETLVHQALRPNSRGYHAAGNFLPVAGLAGFVPDLPFAPWISAASVTGLRQAGGRAVYGVRAELDLDTPVAGAARACVVETLGDGAVTAAVRDIQLTGRQTVEWEVAPADWGARDVRVQVRDPADGNLLAERRIDDTAAIRVIRKACAGRHYYASEPTAEFRVEVGLPAELLGRAVLALEAGGRICSETRGLQPRMTVGLPVSGLAMGRQTVTVRVLLDGVELASQPVPVTRLEPRPGFEVQADRLRGVLLKNQEPFFPVGVYGHTLQWRLGVQNCEDDDEAMFRFLGEDIGLNLVVRSGSPASAHLPRFMELAQRYGLQVITWTYPVAHAPMSMMRQRLGGRVDFSTLDLPESIRHAMEHDPGFWSGVHGSLPTAERLRFRKAVYDRLADGAAAEAAQLRTYPNLLAYLNIDEPNLVNPDDRIAAADWYWNTVDPVDPHRPKLFCYARQIPHGDRWTRWGEILAYDVYTYPYRGTFSSQPGAIGAWYAWQLRERCRQDDKIMWFIPLCNMVDPARSPIGLSRDQMLCEAYAAVIYGARGLVYFALNNVIGQDAWDALRTIAAQVRELAPALLGGDPEQAIRYPPDSFRPREQVFPMVNAAAFRFPDGQVLLLAVNIRPTAVQAGFRVGSLRSGTRLFAGTPDGAPLRIEAGSFQDRFEPYGVRAYRLDLGGPEAPIEVALDLADCPDERAPEPDLIGTVRRAMMGRNHMPNPCFERQTNPGVPDFYRPYFCLSTDPYWGKKGVSDWYVDDAVRWNGHASLRMYKRGVAERGFKTRGLTGCCYPPASDKPVPMVFSFYARADPPNATLWIQLGKEQTVGPIGGDWSRYSHAFTLSAGARPNLGACSFLLIPSAKSAIWISGLQIEQGLEPTEFQDDAAAPAAAPVPAPAAEVGGHRLSNPGAETGTATGWTGFEALPHGVLGIRRGDGRTGDYAFDWHGQSKQILSDWVAVDPAKDYALSGWFRADTGSVSGLVFGLLLADARQRPILHWNVFSRPGTRTELAEPCRPGDRLLRVRDASAWAPGASFVAALGAEENTVTFDIVPRGVESIVNEGAVWRIALNTPCGLERPAGTPVVQNVAGNNGLFLRGPEIPDRWTEWKGRIAARQWWPGTAYARVVVLGLRPGSGALRMDDFRFEQVE